MAKEQMKQSEAAEAIKTAFWELLREKPVGKITVKMIAERAGYSRYTFYQHFRDVYDVLEQIENHVLEQTDQVYLSLPERYAPGQTHPTVDDLVWISTETEGLHYKYLPVLFGPHGDPDFRRKLTERFRRYLKLYFPVYFSEESVELDLMADFYIAGYFAALDFIGPNADRVSYREAMEILFRRLHIPAEG